MEKTSLKLESNRAAATATRRQGPPEGRPDRETAARRVHRRQGDSARTRRANEKVSTAPRIVGRRSEPVARRRAADLMPPVALVGDEPVAEAPEAGFNEDEPRNSLASYFREVAGHRVLSAAEERKATSEIADWELTFWTTLFAIPWMVAPALEVIEDTLSAPPAEAADSGEGAEATVGAAEAPRRAEVLDALRASAQAVLRRPGPVSRRRLQDAAARAAEMLRTLDVDRRCPELVVAMFESQQLGDAGQRRHLSDLRRTLREAVSRRDAFLEANLRLVIAMARRYHHDQMSLGDLIQEGNLGLIKGLARYDHRRGIKFSTYASWWIRHAINRALAEKGREVRLPVHLIDAQRRITKAERQLRLDLGRPATLEETAVAMDMPLERLTRLKTHLRDQVLSLDQPTDDEDGRELGERLRDPNRDEVSAFEQLADQQVRDSTLDLLGELCSPLEADILRWRFGIGKDRELTLREVGERYGMSRERIRQIQEQALDKLRRAARRRHIV